MKTCETAHCSLGSGGGAQPGVCQADHFENTEKAAAISKCSVANQNRLLSQFLNAPFR
jgi:hypothetical protein